MSGTSAALRAAERLLGKRGMWRLGRALYAHGRGEVANSIETNGEATLIANVLAARPAPAVFFDVGANVGDWSRAALRLGAPRIFAFEPAPEARAQLADLPIEVAALAVSDRAGVARFVLREPTAGTNSLAGDGEGGTIEVETTTVADFAAARGIDHIDLLKIDVEGFDLSVIRGALPLLKAGRIAVLQFEYNWRWIQTRSYLRDVFELIAPLDYRLGKLGPDGVALYPEWHFELDRYFEGNYVLARPDMLAAIRAREGSFDRFNTYD